MSASSTTFNNNNNDNSEDSKEKKKKLCVSVMFSDFGLWSDDLFWFFIN